ncbi:MAG: hypothetical protein OEW37_08585 [Rhodospirillaceae bacterium]|nr:hypothetical protein [Rhodospirillaceae bacterium]
MKNHFRLAGVLALFVFITACTTTTTNYNHHIYGRWVFDPTRSDASFVKVVDQANKEGGKIKWEAREIGFTKNAMCFSDKIIHKVRYKYEKDKIFVFDENGSSKGAEITFDDKDKIIFRAPFISPNTSVAIAYKRIESHNEDYCN